MITLVQGPRVAVPECTISIQVTVDEFSRQLNLYSECNAFIWYTSFSSSEICSNIGI